MHKTLVKDLSQTKGRQLFTILNDFRNNARWAGYFFGGEIAETLYNLKEHVQLPKGRDANIEFHVTVWHSRSYNPNVHDLLLLIAPSRPITLGVTGYENDGTNQAISVEKPPVFMSPATPHVTISWASDGNAAASGYLHFDTLPDEYPDELHNGELAVIMKNGRVMDMSVYHQKLAELVQERLSELSVKLNPAIASALNRAYTNKTLAEAPIDQFISLCKLNNVDVNANDAWLYVKYRECLSQDFGVYQLDSATTR
jgi:hypothetical protein